MEDKLLPRFRQNELFAAVQDLDLNPRDFHWGKVQPKGTSDKYLASQLVHVPTGLYFTFAGGSDYYWSEWWPPDDRARSSELVRSWDAQRELAHAWLTFVKSEAQAPDLWGAVTAEAALASAALSEGKNDRFTVSELKAIEQQLDEIAAYIQVTHARDDEARQFVAKRISYLKSAAGRLGRIDWLNIVVAQLLAMAVAGVIPATAVGDLMRFAGNALKGVIDAAARLLQ